MVTPYNTISILLLRRFPYNMNCCRINWCCFNILRITRHYIIAIYPQTGVQKGAAFSSKLAASGVDCFVEDLIEKWEKAKNKKRKEKREY